jgi:hypothetical protein
MNIRADTLHKGDTEDDDDDDNNNNNNNNNNNKIQHTWNVKAKLMPVIKWANRNTSKSFTQLLGNIGGKHEIKELQKTAMLGTAYLLQKVLM